MFEELKEKRNITDVIGEDYKKWENGEIIFITASTGSGKSYFILHTFLKWALEKGMKILYLVNREILKKQLENNLNQISYEYCTEWGFRQNIENFISIRTYQSIENHLRNFQDQKENNILNKFQCVVCDECHYFYTDSNFNTGTELSYTIINNVFSNKIRVYISATIENMKRRIENDKQNYGDIHTIHRLRENEVYGLEKNYEKIRLKIIDDDDSLILQITESLSSTHEKWLVFVDRIDKGKKIKKAIQNKMEIEKDGIIFIDADYEEDVDTNSTVKEIVNCQKTKKRVVISTAVMDNGISFSDEDLINIAIFADTKETFLQMLGRKRENKKEIQLYICKRNKEHFTKRFQYVEQILQCYERYKEEIHILYRQDLNRQEEFHRAHQKILNIILSDNYEGNFMRKICCAANGLIRPNSFSISRCIDLKKYYSELKEKIEKDENAFLKQQAEWLGLSEDKLNRAIAEFEVDEFTKNFKMLKNEIEDIIDNKQGKLTEEENIEWKIKIRKSLEFFIEKAEQEGEKIKGSSGIGKSDRPLTEDLFNTCMDVAQLPYSMKKSLQKEDSYCTIIRKES